MKIGQGSGSTPWSPTPANRGDAAGKTATASEGAAQVSISALSGQLHAIQSNLAQGVGFDSARVDAIKAAIRAGEFRVNPGKVADKLLASVRELGASILLMGPKAKVITPAIVESWFSTSTELTAAMALLQTLAVAVALVPLFTVARRVTQPPGE